MEYTPRIAAGEGAAAQGLTRNQKKKLKKKQKKAGGRDEETHSANGTNGAADAVCSSSLFSTCMGAQRSAHSPSLP